MPYLWRHPAQPAEPPPPFTDRRSCCRPGHPCPHKPRHRPGLGVERDSARPTPQEGRQDLQHIKEMVSVDALCLPAGCWFSLDRWRSQKCLTCRKLRRALPTPAFFLEVVEALFPRCCSHKCHSTDWSPPGTVLCSKRPSEDLCLPQLLEPCSICSSRERLGDEESACAGAGELQQ